MNTRKLLIISFIILMMTSCGNGTVEDTFESDIEILQNVEDLTILKNNDAMIAVSGAYQGRIFTSSTKGMKGRSCGYFNKAAFIDGSSSKSLTKVAGEGRMYFGPEIGKYAIFFEPNTPQNGSTISPSPDLNTVLFNVIEKNDLSITTGNKMNIRNANSYIFNIEAKRKISLKKESQIEEELGVKLNNNISSVGFSAETWIKNIGKEQWTKENGLLSIWDLGCIKPTPRTIVIIPTRNNIEAVTNYFTPLNNDRVKVNNGLVFYSADAAYMNKIGILPNNTLPIYGAYSPEIKLLTIVKFNFEDAELYANSVWGHSIEDTYKGDVINIFNGEVNKELDRNWNFFEMETSSAMKELKPSEELYHNQTIYHFEGDQKYLNEISFKLFGVLLEDVKI